MDNICINCKYIRKTGFDYEWYYFTCNANSTLEFNFVDGKIYEKFKLCKEVNTHGRCPYFEKEK